VTSLIDIAYAGGAKEARTVESKLVIMLDGAQGQVQCVEFPEFNRDGWLKVNHLRPNTKTINKNVLLKKGQNLLDLSTQGAVIGRFSLNIKPADAEVSLNGKVLSGSLQNLSAPVGGHELSVRKEGYHPSGGRVAVTPCGANTYSVSLQKIRTQIKPLEVVKKPASKAVEMILPGDRIKDCPTCPELVVVGTGEFVMGNKTGGLNGDAPLRRIEMDHQFAVSNSEVTFAQWDACVADGGCGGYSPDDKGWGRANRPVIYVNWQDAQAYVKWLSQKSGQTYRLPSEAEWEYVARAGTTGDYWWGDEIGVNQANCANCQSQFDGKKTAPVGSFQANSFGLFDTVGNVWEWVEDCYAKDTYKTHRSYPAPYENGYNSCNRVLRGGAWDLVSQGASASFRYNASINLRSNAVGFRVVRDVK
jgi:formylglycine-generating enzyme required for sulfatase activity